MLGVYNNMVLGLAVTGLVAMGTNMLAVTRDPAEAAARFHSFYLTSFGVALYGSPLRYVVMLAPLAFIFFFSFRIDRMSAASARNMFFAFSAVMGLSLSSIFFVYSPIAIAQAFAATAAGFAALSLYGYTTKRDLSAFGTFLIIGLVGLIVASLINMFVNSGPLGLMISLVGVLLFAGLTAYDTQRTKSLYFQVAGYGPEMVGKAVVMSALSLYLDFINMFLFILRLFGGNRN